MPRHDDASHFLDLEAGVDNEEDEDDEEDEDEDDLESDPEKDGEVDDEDLESYVPLGARVGTALHEEEEAMSAALKALAVGYKQRAIYARERGTVPKYPVTANDEDNHTINAETLKPRPDEKPLYAFQVKVSDD